MDEEEMIRCLDALADYMERKDESPICAKDIRKIRNALKKAWEDAEYWEDMWEDDYAHDC